MAITNMDTLIAALVAGDKPTYQKQTLTSVANFYYSLWKIAGQPGAASTPPTGAGEAPTRATAGAIGAWTNSAGSDVARLAGLNLTSDDLGVYTLYDRLVHTSGLNGTTITAQTINSSALTRYTSGVGVEAWLEIYAALGITSRTATISYTNQDGTAGRSGSCLTGTSAPVGRMIPFSLQAGDTGVRSIETLTLSASTGTAGDFGVTLLKRLADIPASSTTTYLPRDAFDLGLPEIVDDACLAFMAFTGATTLGPAFAQLNIAKG